MLICCPIFSFDSEKCYSLLKLSKNHCLFQGKLLYYKIFNDHIEISPRRADLSFFYTSHFKIIENVT